MGYSGGTNTCFGRAVNVDGADCKHIEHVGAEDGFRGAIKLLRVFSGRLQRSGHVHGAYLGLEPCLL